MTDLHRLAYDRPDRAHGWLTFLVLIGPPKFTLQLIGEPLNSA